MKLLYTCTPLDVGNGIMYLSSAFAEDRGSEYRGQVRALQERIRELERAEETRLTASPRTVHTLSSERGV